MRAHPWAQHPLGDPDSWPQSLKSAVSICLGSRFPILLWWGPELFMLYNDAYRPMLGATKHPGALGQRGRECWPEIWDVIGPMLEGTVLARGEATWSHDQMLLLVRNGFPEECYFTFTYSPIRDESDRVGGVFCAVIETTDRVVGDRRMRLLKELSALASDSRDEAHVCAGAVAAIERFAADVPFAALYRQDAGDIATRVASTARAPQELPDRVLRATPLDIAVPHIAVPFDVPGHPGAGGLLVAGVNPQRPLDAGYREFLTSVGVHIGRAVADARAFEAERARAEALAALDEAKTLFFSNVSHEFRTPLTLLLGPVQDALASPARALGDEGLRVVHRNALRLLKLVNTLLDFASIEAGRARATFHDTDLAAYTAELVAAFRSAADLAGLYLEVQGPATSEPVQVDRAMWETIVFNLLSNALKYTFEGGITVSTCRHDDTMQLTVRDTGVGIAARDLPRIFERFHRVRVDRARTHEGSGIGLALVQELVRLHGGTIAARSSPGEGTTFDVVIPVRQPADAARVPAARASSMSRATQADAYVADALGFIEAPLPASPPPIASGFRILVADDNADMRAYLQRLLGERWQVDVVPDGAAALSAVRSRPPDLLIADVMMPGLDGLELLETLRRDPRTATVPVMLLSARAGEHATIEGVAAGADDYLVKPFSTRDLLTRVEAQLARAHDRALVRERMMQVESVIEHAPLGVYLVDQDFRIAHVNPVARPVLGDLPDLIGRDFGEIVRRRWGAAQAAEVLARFRHTLDTGEPWVESEWAEARAERGETAYHEWRVVRMTLPDGRFGLACYFRDISAQVRARMALETSERRFRAFVTTTADAVYRMNADWSELQHLEGKAFIPSSPDPTRTWLERYIHPDDRGLVLDAIHDAIERKGPFELEHRVVRADGSLGWVLSRAVPHLDEAGRLVEWFGTARDVTLRRQTDEALARVTAYTEQQRRLYETILSSTPDLVYVFDRQHRFTYANRALLAMWGKTWEQAIGRTFPDLGYPDWHGAMHDREIEQVIATRLPIRGEVPYTGTQGRHIYDYIFVPVLGEHGEVEAVAGTTRDVTEYKRVEDALRDREQRLADANRVKDEFLATLSHELRTPLNAVLGWAHLLRNEALPPHVQARAFDALERNAKAQAQLVDDLLDVSRIMSGKLSMRSQPVDLARVIGDAVDTVRPAAEARRLVLDVEVTGAGEVTVLGDDERLQQVIWNLLANAVKFTPPGGRVGVTLQRDDAHAEVVVTDTGEGIPAEFLPHVFERFQQADSAPSRKHGGLGLGLSLVRHLTEAHGGTVAVHSHGLDRGATFRVRLPLIGTGQAPAQTGTGESEASRTASANSDAMPATAPQSVSS